MANSNATVGFDAFFDSEFNVFSANTARKNGLFDARDAGTANDWTNNNFGTTQGI